MTVRMGCKIVAIPSSHIRLRDALDVINPCDGEEGRIAPNSGRGSRTSFQGSYFVAVNLDRGLRGGTGVCRQYPVPIRTRGKRTVDARGYPLGKVLGLDEITPYKGQ